MTTVLFLKYPRFTCKNYFKPRFRFILSGKVTFNQIWTFRPRRWNMLTTLLTILLVVIRSKQRRGFKRQSNLVTSSDVIAFEFMDVRFHRKKWQDFCILKAFNFWVQKKDKSHYYCKLTQLFSSNQSDLHNTSIISKLNLKEINSWKKTILIDSFGQIIKLKKN